MTYENEPDESRGTVQRIQDVRSSRPYRGTTLLLSIALIAVILIGAAWVFFTQDDDGKQAGPQGPAPSAPAVTAPGAGTSTEELFGVPTYDATGVRRVEQPRNPMGAVLPQKPAKTPPAKSAPPEGLTWELVYQVTLPFSTSDGPTAISADGVPKGFARTPQGATMAALQINRRIVAAPREQARAIVEQLLYAPTPDAQKAADALANIPAQLDASGRSELFTLTAVPVAIKVPDFSQDYARVEFAVRVGQSLESQGIVAMRGGMDMVWRDGTWKWVVPTTKTSQDSNYLRSLDSDWNRGW